MIGYRVLGVQTCNAYSLAVMNVETNNVICYLNIEYQLLVAGQNWKSF